MSCDNVPYLGSSIKCKSYDPSRKLHLVSLEAGDCMMNSTLRHKLDHKATKAWKLSP